MSRGENFPLVFHFLLVLSFFKLCFWTAESTSAYFSLKYSAMNSLQKMDSQTPFAKYAEGLWQQHMSPGQSLVTCAAAAWWTFSQGQQARQTAQVSGAPDPQRGFQNVLHSLWSLQGSFCRHQMCLYCLMETGGEQITLYTHTSTSQFLKSSMHSTSQRQLPRLSAA